MMEGSISAINTGIECSNCRNNCVNYYTGECYRCGYRADYTPKEMFERYNKKDSKEIKCSKCGEKASPRFTYDENVLCPKCKYGEYLGTKEMFEQYDKMVKEPEEIEQSIEEKEGVTLRDRFAMSALESAISTPALYRDTNERAVIAARISYIFADAMLKAREESC